MNKAANTRNTILKKAFALIYKNGYQTTSIDEIIKTTNVTKGAFFYHFKNKDEMGLAIIQEMLNSEVTNNHTTLLLKTKDPLKSIYSLIENLLYHNPFLKPAYGCPTGNLIQEISSANDKFRIALKENVDQWYNSIESCIEMGKKNGKIRQDVDPKSVTYFIMSCYWGIRSIGKLHNSDEIYKPYLKELKSYLSSLE